MKLLSVLGAIGVGVFAASWLGGLQRRGAAGQSRRRGLININQASQQELMSLLGLDADTAERIVEHRPYPSKLDLLGRMIVPDDVYVAIKDRIVYKAG
jgi:DNA uptake protein ComE-like DNA-binding protein